MLLQSGIDLNLNFRVLDPDPHAPCSKLTDFTCGKLTDYQTVFDFGQACDLIAIEIENVNTQALADLGKAGKKVFPQPEIIELIRINGNKKSSSSLMPFQLPNLYLSKAEKRYSITKHFYLL